MGPMQKNSYVVFCSMIVCRIAIATTVLSMSIYCFNFSQIAYCSGAAEMPANEMNGRANRANVRVDRVKKSWKAFETSLMVSALMFITCLFIIPTIFYALPSKEFQVRGNSSCTNHHDGGKDKFKVGMARSCNLIVTSGFR